MVLSTVSVVRDGARWAVKHNGGFLGFAESEDAAVNVARDLLSWLDGEGQPAELVVEAEAVRETRSFAPAG